jgi:hypothetical protein
LRFSGGARWKKRGWYVSRCGVGGICGLVRRVYGLGMRF